MMDDSDDYFEELVKGCEEFVTEQVASVKSASDVLTETVKTLDGKIGFQEEAFAETLKGIDGEFASLKTRLHSIEKSFNENFDRSSKIEENIKEYRDTIGQDISKLKEDLDKYKREYSRCFNETSSQLEINMKLYRDNINDAMEKCRHDVQSCTKAFSTIMDKLEKFEKHFVTRLTLTEAFKTVSEFLSKDIHNENSVSKASSSMQHEALTIPSGALNNYGFHQEENTVQPQALYPVQLDPNLTPVVQIETLSIPQNEPCNFPVQDDTDAIDHEEVLTSADVALTYNDMDDLPESDFKSELSEYYQPSPLAASDRLSPLQTAFVRWHVSRNKHFGATNSNVNKLIAMGVENKIWTTGWCPPDVDDFARYLKTRIKNEISKSKKDSVQDLDLSRSRSKEECNKSKRESIDTQEILKKKAKKETQKERLQLKLKQKEGNYM